MSRLILPENFNESELKPKMQIRQDLSAKYNLFTVSRSVEGHLGRFGHHHILSLDHLNCVSFRLFLWRESTEVRLVNGRDTDYP